MELEFFMCAEIDCATNKRRGVVRVCIRPCILCPTLHRNPHLTGELQFYFFWSAAHATEDMVSLNRECCFGAVLLFTLHVDGSAWAWTPLNTTVGLLRDLHDG
jgi:hypothetical protein